MLNGFDIFFAVVTIGFAILGFREGFVKSILNLIGFVAAVIVVLAFSQTIFAIAELIPVLPHALSAFILFITAVVACTVIVHIIASFVQKLVHMTPAAFIDNGLGCAFGIVKALVLGGIVAFVLSCAPQGSFVRLQYDNSVSAPHLVTFIAESIPFISRLTPYYPSFTPEPSEPEQKQNEQREKNLI